MLIGVPKEIKTHEYRVGLVPSSVTELVSNGHEVWVESDAGQGIGIKNADYEEAGAQIKGTAQELFKSCDMIIKVKEPQLQECQQLHKNQILFTFLHLAADPEQTAALVKSDCIAIAYETVTDAQGRLPLLSPMSEVAGRMSIQEGAHCLEKPQGGSGVLLSGVPGVAPGKIVILGGGVVGSHALRMAIGMQAHVTIMDKSLARLKELDMYYGTQVDTLYATQQAIATQVKHADLVIGAVLVPGGAAPKLVTREMLRTMRPGSAVVDVAIDQGGCFETSRPTTHADPIYIEENIVHYCVTNMPGAVPRTSTFALNNATLPFILALANKGVKQAISEDPHLRAGLNICRGKVTYQAVAQDLGYEYVPAEKAL